MAQAAIQETLSKRTNIETDSFSGLLVEYARKRGAIALVRGVRVLSDFEYEFQMALMNRKMAGDISTVFLMPDEKYTYLTSSIVRELAGHGQDVGQFVPAVVAEALKKKFTK
jgi:pantetheine-phosphate adenylyltransferase